MHLYLGEALYGLGDAFIHLGRLIVLMVLFWTSLAPSIAFRASAGDHIHAELGHF